MLISSYFPAERQFMIKPQAKLRPPLSETPEESELTLEDFDRSFDSYHQAVQPRGEGRELEMYEPDFVVVEGSESMNEDIPFLLVEAKRDDSSLSTAMAQALQYLTRMQGIQKTLATRHALETVVHAMLVLGESTLLFSLRGDDDITQGTWLRVTTSGSEVQALLQGLQNQHQNGASTARR